MTLQINSNFPYSIEIYMHIYLNFYIDKTHFDNWIHDK